MKAFARARGYHLRHHGGPLLGCSEVICASRVQRLRSGAQLHTIAQFEKGGRMHEVRAALLAGTGDR